jgi:hypothetical protein
MGQLGVNVAVSPRPRDSSGLSDSPVFLVSLLCVRTFGRDLRVVCSDLGWSIRLRFCTGLRGSWVTSASSERLMTVFAGSYSGKMTVSAGSSFGRADFEGNLSG